ncbi:caspase family protein [Emticicia sp. W12TSBA100-4]|uniref:caspase family protein n=1 Tax=Emticicia sp. W12TSBA100-4 TaxID=3160965 RepID=UPI003305C498
MKAILSILYIYLSLLSNAQVGSKELTPTKKSENPIIKGKVRKTLVIGNSNYINLKQLQVCEMDADSIGKRLINFNFSPIIRKNLNFEGMKSEFEASIDSLPPQSEVIIYFSGHGLHVGEKDYLLPIDFMADCLNYTSKIDEKAISLQWIMNKLSKKQISNSVIILDACRNILSDCENYCLGSSFSEAEKIPNIAVLFGASNCQTSGYDRIKPTNSFFTSGLLYALNYPQFPLGEVFSKAYTKTMQIASEHNYSQKPFGAFQSAGMIINNTPLKKDKIELPNFLDYSRNTDTKIRDFGSFKMTENDEVSDAKIWARDDALANIGSKIKRNCSDVVMQYINRSEKTMNDIIERKCESSFTIYGYDYTYDKLIDGTYYIGLEVNKQNVINEFEKFLRNEKTLNIKSKRELIETFKIHIK